MKCGENEILSWWYTGQHSWWSQTVRNAVITNVFVCVGGVDITYN